MRSSCPERLDDGQTTFAPNPASVSDATCQDELFVCLCGCLLVSAGLLPELSPTQQPRWINLLNFLHAAIAPKLARRVKANISPFFASSFAIFPPKMHPFSARPASTQPSLDLGTKWPTRPTRRSDASRDNVEAEPSRLGGEKGQSNRPRRRDAATKQPDRKSAARRLTDSRARRPPAMTHPCPITPHTHTHTHVRVCVRISSLASVRLVGHTNTAGQLDEPKFKRPAGKASHRLNGSCPPKACRLAEWAARSIIDRADLNLTVAGSTSECISPLHLSPLRAPQFSSALAFSTIFAALLSSDASFSQIHFFSQPLLPRLSTELPSFLLHFLLLCSFSRHNPPHNALLTPALRHTVELIVGLHFICLCLALFTRQRYLAHFSVKLVLTAGSQQLDPFVHPYLQTLLCVRLHPSADSALHFTFRGRFDCLTNECACP
ncbi:unnamed protein product [Protopolystoma xenopodis]|uniref:Uncharacterized protein n=1 Tax=Protopolystoma xenopodis TaxID=117903 RepID=A0A448WQC0_9PLAT|nr:unnamed protein product [Protopolystoma xenopodis]